MIEEALHKGYSYSNPESGIHYFVLGAGSAPDSESFSKGIEQGIVYILNEAKKDQTWGCYYPFTLSIRKPELLYAFLKGDVYVMVVFDAAKMKTLALERGLSFSLLHEEDWAYGFERSVKEFEEPIKFKISQHFATRMALEFFSLKWVLDIHGHNMEEMEQQLINQVEA